MLQVALKPGLPGGCWAVLRPLCGNDEARTGTDLVAATDLLDRLLIETPGTSVAPGTAQDLAVCDCDRLLAALYRRYFGDNVEGTITCAYCHQPFDLRFSLNDLVAELNSPASSDALGPDSQGLYTLADGRRFRLPTTRDQHLIAGLDPEQAARDLLARCVVEGEPAADPDLVQRAMDEVGAMLNLDLDAGCSECGATQSVHFDIQSYLLRALRGEQRFLHREVHILASTYGWGHDEILNLSREDRRAFVRLIEADRHAATQRRALV